MSDTVRDAVFGNVGTMISFRVSADDAPILAKSIRAELRINRPSTKCTIVIFVVNMVIGGEKTPAFSARTLELPPSQADNTPHIY